MHFRALSFVHIYGFFSDAFHTAGTFNVNAQMVMFPYDSNLGKNENKTRHRIGSGKEKEEKDDEGRLLMGNLWKIFFMPSTFSAINISPSSTLIHHHGATHSSMHEHESKMQFQPRVGFMLWQRIPLLSPCVRQMRLCWDRSWSKRIILPFELVFRAISNCV